MPSPHSARRGVRGSGQRNGAGLKWPLLANRPVNWAATTQWLSRVVNSVRQHYNLRRIIAVRDALLPDQVPQLRKKPINGVASIIYTIVFTVDWLPRFTSGGRLCPARPSLLQRRLPMRQAHWSARGSAASTPYIPAATTHVTRFPPTSCGLTRRRAGTAAGRACLATMTGRGKCAFCAGRCKQDSWTRTSPAITSAATTSATSCFNVGSSLLEPASGCLQRHTPMQPSACSPRYTGQLLSTVFQLPFTQQARILSTYAFLRFYISHLCFASCLSCCCDSLCACYCCAGLRHVHLICSWTLRCVTYLRSTIRSAFRTSSTLRRMEELTFIYTTYWTHALLPPLP